MSSDIKLSTSTRSWMGIWFQGGFAALGAIGIIVLIYFFMGQFETMQKYHREDMREMKELERYERQQLKEELRAVNERHWKAVHDLRDAMDLLRLEVMERGNRTPAKAAGTPEMPPGK